LYNSIIRPLLFKLSPEKAHHLTFSLLKATFVWPVVPFFIKKGFQIKDHRLEKEVFGIKFKNPVGLAAGLDKDARMIDEFAALGFGFVEIGTITPKGQPGNEKPRLFRLPKDHALINRMGFNNEGAMAAAERLKKVKSDIIIGGNIGKNKITPNDEAVNDYINCFEILFPYVHYFAVNVSSPNTPGLRSLQEKEPLKKILAAVQQKNTQTGNPKPVLLKIAPDLTESQLDDIIEIVRETGIAGVIATNTTISRECLTTNKETIEKIGAGGLSGKPVKVSSTWVIKYLADKSGKAFPIIGVGGIESPEDALEKIEAGADLVQLYTGFIYQGPSLVKRINRAILKRFA
jgi:dihydroorotate dehydrogenase